MMRAIFFVPVLLALAAATGRAAATEIYKWVDERGVTNYSSAPPASAKARRLDQESASVSVYSPPPVNVARLQDSIRRRQIARLEEEVQAQRRATATLQQEVDAGQYTREQCLREGRLDCDLIDGGVAPGYFLPGPGGMIRPTFFRPSASTPLMRTRLVTRRGDPTRRRHSQ